MLAVELLSPQAYGVTTSSALSAPFGLDLRSPLTHVSERFIHSALCALLVVSWYARQRMLSACSMAVARRRPVCVVGGFFFCKLLQGLTVNMIVGHFSSVSLT